MNLARVILANVSLLDCGRSNMPLDKNLSHVIQKRGVGWAGDGDGWSEKVRKPPFLLGYLFRFGTDSPCKSVGQSASLESPVQIGDRPGVLRPSLLGS
jgi:hypothetical protein